MYPKYKQHYLHIKLFLNYLLSYLYMKLLQQKKKKKKEKKRKKKCEHEKSLLSLLYGS